MKVLILIVLNVSDKWGHKKYENFEQQGRNKITNKTEYLGWILQWNFIDTKTTVAQVQGNFFTKLKFLHRTENN